MLELTGHVDFAGVVDDAGLPELYAGAHAVLLPSLHEGFGLPALEALAAGVPLAVADAGALPQLVAEHGMVLPAVDATAWTEALLWFAQTPDTLAIFAIRPERCLIMCGATAWVKAISPTTLVSNWSLRSSMDKSITGPIRA